MGKPRVKPNYRRRVLRLPDLDHCKTAVLNSLGSPASRRVYEYAIDQFIAWYCSEPRLAFNRIVVVRYRMYLESRQSDSTAAIRYTLTLWDALGHYIKDGRLDIDNNAAERALRAVALGRKNYLFAGSDLGGERAATIYSLIGTAKLNNLDPEAYLREVLTRIAEYPVNRIADLLPWNVAATKEVST
jgi:Transposase IS66 family/IS66 C-terminal element